MKKISDCSVDEILSTSPYLLNTMINEEYVMRLPETVSTVDEMQAASIMLSKFINSYSYLIQLAQYAKIYVRQLKRDKENPKTVIEDAIDRKEIISAAADVVKAQYNAVSRMITIKKEINEELKMTDGKY